MRDSKRHCATVILWQDDLVSVAKFIHACLDKMFSCETGLPNDSQASDQPDVAGRDVT